MKNLIMGVVVISVGVLSIIYREKFVNEIFKQQRELFGLKFSDRIKEMDVKFSIFMGIVFIIVGILTVFGIWA